MPSSLATVLSLTSGSSPCPPVSVLVRAAMELSLETFPGSWPHVLHYLSVDFHLPVTFYIPMTHFTVILLFASPTIHSVGHISLLRHSFTSIAGTGISEMCIRDRYSLDGRSMCFSFYVIPKGFVENLFYFVKDKKG